MRVFLRITSVSLFTIQMVAQRPKVLLECSYDVVGYALFVCMVQLRVHGGLRDHFILFRLGANPFPVSCHTRRRTPKSFQLF